MFLDQVFTAFIFFSGVSTEAMEKKPDDVYIKINMNKSMRMRINAQYNCVSHTHFFLSIENSMEFT